MTTPAPSASSTRIARLLATRRNYREEVLALCASKRFVTFYGCGNIFRSIAGPWHEFTDRKVDFCCDSDPAKWGKEFSGVPCISPVELERIKDDAVVFVTVGNFEPVLASLSERSFPCVHLIYKFDLVSAEYLAAQDHTEVAAKLEQVRAMLADEHSVRVFDAILDRLLDSATPEDVMAGVCEGNQYFPPDVIRLKPDESFVDVGAFTGDTISDFLKRIGGSFSSIHGFEMDAANFHELQNTVATLPCAERIFLHPEGCWNESREISYSMAECQSSIGEGEARGQVVRLDDALGNARVTFLKMDIEGAESQALEGARATLLANQPKLAICVYHHIKDLWEIPLFIKGLLPEHRIYLRHHTKLEYETVCYAVPPAEVIA